MTLYYGVTMYQLLVMIVQQMEEENALKTFSSNDFSQNTTGDSAIEDAQDTVEASDGENIPQETPSPRTVLLVHPMIKKQFPNYSMLSIVFDQLWEMDASLSLPQSEPDIWDALVAHYDAFFLDHGVHIENFTDIRISTAHSYFGIYLVLKGQHFCFYEDGAGLLSRPEILYDITPSAALRNGMAQRHGLYDGSCYLVHTKVGNQRAQLPDYSCDNFQNFNVYESFQGLSDTQKDFILTFFNVPSKLDIPPNSVILLSQHFSTLDLLSLKDHILIYQLTWDYFFSEASVIIKPHPRDLLRYETILPSVQVIRRVFPSEFLPLVAENSSTMVATINSTAIQSLAPLYEHTFELGNEYLQDFKLIHQYYFAIKIAKALGYFEMDIASGNEVLFHRLAKSIWENYQPTGTTTPDMRCLISDASEFTSQGFESLLRSEGDGPGIFFINAWQNADLYAILKKNQTLENLVILTLKKRKTRKLDVYMDTKEEHILFYSSNERKRKMAMELSAKIKLAATGLEITVPSGTQEEQTFRILTGMLEAMENQLYKAQQQEEKALKEVSLFTKRRK